MSSMKLVAFVTHLPPAINVWVQSQAIPYGICSRLVALQYIFLQVLQFFPP